MATNTNSHTAIGAASLAVGPLIMAVGDLLHPEEASDVSAQAAIVVAHATRWYVAHLLLLVGLVVLVPGLLLLTELAGARSRRAGHAVRALVVIGVAGVAGVFLVEMIAGRLGSVNAASTEHLLDAMLSGPIAAPMIPVMLAFFIGLALVAVPLIKRAGPFRWPAAAILTGLVLILAEIISAQVLLSQIGNVLVWGGGAAFAWQLFGGREVGAMSR
jgi:hypothetical protein